MKKTNTGKKSNSFRIAVAVFVIALAVSFAGVEKRPPTSFKDLPSTHWASNDIMSLYQGGLVNGMGDGNFGADQQLTVAQMATMIANAQGIDISTSAGEPWYVPPMRHAKEIGIISSTIDPTSADEANKPCSREQAVYMVINSLGVANGLTRNSLTMNDIPDFGLIDTSYRDAALTAVQFGIIKGKDSQHTFAPKDILTRAEVCAILNRAGYNEAKEVVKESAEGLTVQQIYDKLKATGWFTETTEGSIQKLIAKERKYAGIKVTKSGNFLGINGREWTYNLATDGNSGVYDENGNIVSRDRQYYDSNGKFIPASAYSYNGRQFLKQIFQIAFPNDWDKAYNTVKSVMTAPYAYAGSCSFPSAIEWFDGHYFEMNTSDFLGAGNGYSISIGELNNKLPYDANISEPASSSHYDLQYVVKGTATNFINVVRAYELDKW